MSENDLLLGRLAVGAGHLSKDELTWAIQTAEESGKRLPQILVEEGLLSLPKLQALQASLGGGKSTTRSIPRSLHCALCDETIKVLEFVEGATYTCTVCGAVLDLLEREPEEPAPEPEEEPPLPPVDDDLDEQDLIREATEEYMGLVSAANQLIQQEKLVEAKGKLDQAIQMLPEESPARLSRAWLCLEIGLPQQTVEDASLLIERKTERALALQYRAHARVRTKAYSVALDDLERALEANADGPLLHALRGTCFYKMHKLPQARQEYMMAIEFAKGQTVRPHEKLLAELLEQATRFVEDGRRPDTVRISAIERDQMLAAMPGAVEAPPAPAPAAAPAVAPPPGAEAQPEVAPEPPAPLFAPPVERCHCGEELKAVWRYCPFCARPSGKRCPTCRERLDPKWRRCPYCA